MADYADIIKIVTTLIKTTCKDSKKTTTNELEIMYENANYLYFLICQKLLISGEKLLMSVELKRCVK